MKKLEFKQMAEINGGTSPALVAATEAACFAMGFSFGLVSFGFGFVMGVGCSMLVESVA